MQATIGWPDGMSIFFKKRRLSTLEGRVSFPIARAPWAHEMAKKYQALAVVRNIPYTRVMSAIENIAKLTSKSQTTVPIAVRKALSVGPHDQISFTVLDGGRVEVRKVESSDQDPVVRQYLAFLEEDMMAHPEKLSVIQRDETMRKLLEGVETESFDLSD